MKKLFGQMAADRKWQAKGTTSRQWEVKRIRLHDGFLRSPRKSVRLEKRKQQ